eukprot:g13253.t1
MDETTKLTRTLKTLPDAAPDLEESECFRVMSFNILAQQMASSKMFPYVPKNQLKKGNRAPRVQAEVSRYGADVICLQECDSFDEIMASLREEKTNQGSLYEGVYKRRNNSDNSHGVAVLYDTKRFRLLDSGSCEFGRYLFDGVGAFALLQDRRRRPPHPDPGETVGGHGDLSGPIGTGPGAANGVDRVGGHGDESDTTQGGEEGQAMGRKERWLEESLRPGAALSESGIVCVATSHLYWHPDGGAIRLAQAEVLMASVADFLEERFGESYGSVPLVLAGDLNNVPGIDVYRLLSNGTCEGGTPEAFYRRKRERARARKEEDLKKARQAVALVAQIRARNAAAIAAARSSNSSSAGGGERNGTAPPMAAPGALYSPSPAVVSAAEADTVGEAADEGGNGMGAAAVVAVGGRREEGRCASGATSRETGGGALPTGSVGAAAPTASSSPGPGSFDWSPTLAKFDSESSASNVGIGVARDAPESAIKKPDGDRDGDVRLYEQGFRGLSSAYSAYSSVFDSQLSKKRPSGESSVCEVTGQHTIGHVRLGVRQAGGPWGNGGNGEGVQVNGSDLRTLGDTPLKQQELDEEKEEADRSMGEPQLTTCTDNFAGTIDYIWHTPQLQVRSLLDLPSLNQAMQGGGLPTASYPSDHVSIMAELHWRIPFQQETAQTCADVREEKFP